MSQGCCNAIRSSIPGDHCLLSCCDRLVVGASLLLCRSALLSCSLACSAFQLLLSSDGHQERNNLLQIWHTAGFGNQVETCLFGNRNTALGDKGTGHVSVCRIANYHHLPMHDVIYLPATRFYKIFVDEIFTDGC